MISSKLKAVCLCAGFGSRLAPLTNNQPKAAIRIQGVPALYVAFSKIYAAGIRQVAVNAHHCADQIQELIKQQPFHDLQVYLSYEPVLLGSGGAYKPLELWRNHADLLVYNPDILCDIDLHAFFTQYLESHAIAAVAVKMPPPRGKTARLVVNDQGYLDRLLTDEASIELGTSSVSHIMAHGLGIFILSDLFLSEYVVNEPADVFSLGLSIERALKKEEKIYCYPHSGYWSDFGDSLDDLTRIQDEMATHQGLFRACGGYT